MISSFVNRSTDIMDNCYKRNITEILSKFDIGYLVGLSCMPCLGFQYKFHIFAFFTNYFFFFFFFLIFFKANFISKTHSLMR